MGDETKRRDTLIQLNRGECRLFPCGGSNQMHCIVGKNLVMTLSSNDFGIFSYMPLIKKTMNS